MNFFISLYRIIRFAVQNFWRNIWLSVITVTILVLTLLIVNTLFVLNIVGQTAVKAVESKIDVSVSFVPEANDNIVASARGYLMSLPQVKDARLLTAEDVLTDFKEKNANKPDVLASLEEVGGNPFGPQIIITAHDPSDFSFILEALRNPQYASSIEEKDFQSHETIIGAINHTIDQARIVGIGIGLFFALIAILIVVNTIRVAIYTHREEIGIMRLVGASGWLIRAPFLVEAVMYSLVALVITAVIVFPLLGLIEPGLDTFFVNTPTQLVATYTHQALTIFGVQLIGLCILNVLSTAFALRRYLNA